MKRHNLNAIRTSHYPSRKSLRAMRSIRILRH
ncbi:MAG: hypothetical protein IPJ40_13020 [Saprospirales bacterium]|nr:hypothetical protein [Saprospirales bacterium]